MKIVGTCLVLMALFGLGWLLSDRTEHSGPTGSGQDRFTQACGSCHQLPEPSDLPRSVWDTIVLPRMRQFIAATGADIPPRDWEAITEYILSRAPKSFRVEEVKAPESPLFTAEFPDMRLRPPSGSYVSILPGRGIVLGDINKESLFVFDTTLRHVQQLRTGKGVTAVSTFGTESYATVIGSFSPTDAETGKLVRLEADSVVTIIEGLRRPTGLLALPTRGDSRPSFVITEYGKWAGRLSLYVPDRDGRYGRTVLSHRMGPMAIVRERAKAFLVLYGQGDERIVRYTDTPSGWQETTLVRFPPSYGSSSLRLIDWNGDPWPDLVYTGGDHADYRAAPKPYHGIRIFAGAADGSYRQREFIPLPGAYEALVADFDGDGKQEIAAVAFFPDYRSDQPLSAVIFHRRGEDWITRRLPGAASGRWLRLAAGDLDGDGDLDLVASSLAMEPDPDNGTLMNWLEGGRPFILWKNNLKGNTHRAAERRTKYFSQKF